MARTTVGAVRIAPLRRRTPGPSSLALQPYHLPVTQLHTTLFRCTRQGEPQAVGEHLRLVCYQGSAYLAIHVGFNVPQGLAFEPLCRWYIMASL